MAVPDKVGEFYSRFTKLENRFKAWLEKARRQPSILSYSVLSQDPWFVERSRIDDEVAALSAQANCSAIEGENFATLDSEGLMIIREMGELLSQPPVLRPGEFYGRNLDDVLVELERKFSFYSFQQEASPIAHHQRLASVVQFRSMIEVKILSFLKTSPFLDSQQLALWAHQIQTFMKENGFYNEKLNRACSEEKAHLEKLVEHLRRLIHLDSDFFSAWRQCDQALNSFEENKKQFSVKKYAQGADSYEELVKQRENARQAVLFLNSIVEPLRQSFAKMDHALKGMSVHLSAELLKEYTKDQQDCLDDAIYFDTDFLVHRLAYLRLSYEVQSNDFLSEIEEANIALQQTLMLPPTHPERQIYLEEILKNLSLNYRGFAQGKQEFDLNFSEFLKEAASMESEDMSKEIGRSKCLARQLNQSVFDIKNLVDQVTVAVVKGKNINSPEKLRGSRSDVTSPSRLASAHYRTSSPLSPSKPSGMSPQKVARTPAQDTTVLKTPDHSVMKRLDFGSGLSSSKSTSGSPDKKVSSPGRKLDFRPGLWSSKSPASSPEKKEPGSPDCARR